MRVWGCVCSQALVSFSHTIISDGDTWSHLSMLTVICFITMGICIATDAHKSQWDENAVVGRIQLLISFIFAGYVNVVISRWDRIRNTTLGQTWGALENLNLLAYQLIRSENTKQDDYLCDLMLRHSRLVFQLLFHAVQGVDQLDELKERQLLTETEAKHLRECTIGTRPLVVTAWINQFIQDLFTRYKYPCNEMIVANLASNVANLRGGIGGTQGCIGSQLPYPYVHAVYWTIQILLMALSIETGVQLAIYTYTKKNGNGDYSPNDDTVAWPQHPNVWYSNAFLQITAANVVFALFVEGMLKVCDKLANPMSKDDTSFSETVFDAFLYNNCRAMRAGIESYRTIAISNEFAGTASK